jgi:hypothetical protein
MAHHVLAALCLLGGGLMLGILGYVFLEGMAWEQALLNSATLLTGMGLAEVPRTPAARLFAAGYTLFAGFVFIAVSGIIIAPLLHRLLHRFHWDGE